MKWYSGKYDRAFKEVMLKENNKDILKALLEKILNVTIDELQILNVENLLGNVHVKSQRLDLNLKTNVGRINVEVNSTNYEYVKVRNLAYLFDIYSHSTLVGEQYDINTKYIQINLSYKLGKNNDPIDIYEIKNNKGKNLVDNFFVYVVNMDYYMNLWYTKNKREIDNNLVIVMLGLEKEELLNLSRKDGMVLKYMEELNKVNEEPEFREYMSLEEDQRKIYNTFRKERDDAFKERDDAFKLLDESLKEKNETIKKAKKEKETIVKNMLDSNMSIEDISKITELSIDEVNQIINGI